VDLLDVLPEAVLVLDGQRRVVRGNDRARDLLGLRDGDVGGLFGEVLELLDESGRACPDPVPARGTASRVAEQVLRVRLPDGRERPVSMAGRWQPDGGLVLTFRAAGRREAVDAARSDLVATVSHEIRSPLTSVKGFTSTMLRKWDRFSDEQKRTMLETVNADADRVTRLLKELLDVSRIDAGRVQLAVSRVDVATVVREVAEKAAHRPDGRDREVVVQATDDVPALVELDRDKLEQILTNLLDNALRYAPDATVRLTVDGDGAAGVVLEVIDDGPGIAEDQQRTIFRKFGRGRDVRRSGTGLGLYITRGLALAHGGEVTLVSGEGEGATFTVRLPGRVEPV